jgi:hypothetical protein
MPNRERYPGYGKVDHFVTSAPGAARTREMRVRTRTQKGEVRQQIRIRGSRPKRLVVFQAAVDDVVPRASMSSLSGLATGKKISHQPTSAMRDV